jgi:glyoxylase-like metal-dependent hydrolase (beta-lactamase superfamily II)
MTAAHGLPEGITVFERGWLSSNNILLSGGDGTALVDSGYSTHAQQTLALLQHSLAGRPLDLLLNTHLHSDHCGGNALLQREFPAVRTLIPPGQADAVARWDEVALTYAPTGQTCERFQFDEVLQPGKQIRLGERGWQVHAAPGHDPHSVVLFEPEARVLISADALWENGFGVVFPELEGAAAFDEVAATLDLIAQLRPLWIIPGHGRVFGGEGEVASALGRARGRLDSFVRDPSKHARHAAKVLLKFKLLELQQLPYAELEQWAFKTPYFDLVIARYFPGSEPVAWLRSLVQELAGAGALEVSDGQVLNM